MSRAAACAFLVLLTAASAAQAEDGTPRRGERTFQYCYACHSLEPGETSLQGPNLRGIVGRRIAAQDGFSYSPGLRALAEREGRWSEGLLDRFLAAPYRLVPKTSMGFPGLEDERERADLIAYLRATGESR